MTGFHVVTEQLAAQAGALTGLAAELQTAAAQIAATSSAGAQTPAQGALAHATAAWVQILGQYGAATSGLATAISQAAQTYSATDDGAVPDA